MTIPVCIEIPTTPPPSEITLPGGVTIQHIDLAQIIQPALTPLVPLFNIVDTVVSIFNTLKAVLTLNPKEIGKSIPAVAENVGKLLKMIPQLSLPLMLLGLIDLVIDVLSQARNELVHLQGRMGQVTRMIERAKDLDDYGLIVIAECHQKNIETEARNIGQNLASLGRLFGLINLFMGMIGGPQIPDLSSLSGKPLDEIIEPLDALVDSLKATRKALPIP